MKFFVTAAGEDEVGIPSRTFAVTIDNLPEDAMFWDEDTREESRVILNDAFSALLDAGCYVTFESDPPEEPNDAPMYDHEEETETRE